MTIFGLSTSGTSSFMHRSLIEPLSRGLVYKYFEVLILG